MAFKGIAPNASHTKIFSTARNLAGRACATQQQPPPGRFALVLSERYAQIAHYEADAGRIGNADYFQGKASAALNGQALPDRPRLDRVAAGDGQALNDAYLKLTGDLAAGAARLRPVAMADAQSAFDCWLAQQDRRFPLAPLHCRAVFESSMAVLGTALQPADQSLTVTDVTSVYRITSQSGPDSARSLDLIAQDYRRFMPAGVDVTGPDQPALDFTTAELVRRGIPQGAITLHIAPHHQHRPSSREQSSAAIVVELTH